MYQQLLRVLIVDDDRATRETLAALLEERACEVSTAENGALALQLLEVREAPDLILLDVAMPVMDGAAFLDELRANPRFRWVPVVLITGLLPGRLARIPADGYLPKPISPRALYALVDRFRATPPSSSSSTP